MSGPSASGPVAIRRGRDVLLVAGPDAGVYLQGQLSQDVEALADGGSAYTFLLQPAGKVAAWLRITRVSDEQFVLDVDVGWGALVADRLRRFLLRTACRIEQLEWDLVTVIDAGDVAAPTGGFKAAVEWPGLGAIDLLGPSVESPAGVASADTGLWEFRRIAAGIPAMGSEIDEKTIPAATGVVDRSVSFTKGCYTGQELVARIDSRSAGPPTRLVRVEGSGASVPEAGAVIRVEDAECGRLTSVAPTDAGFVALAYLRRGTDVPVEAAVVWPDGSTTARLLPD